MTKKKTEPTNEELKSLVDELSDQLKAANKQIAKLMAPPPTQPIPKTCINCGQSQTPVIHDTRAKSYKCPICDHEWTDEEEKAPFRWEG